MELHLDFPAGQIVKTKCAEDVGCGVYPCYYRINGDYIEVSTSVISLILHSGEFVYNGAFKPPDFLKPPVLKKLFSSFLFRINKINRLLSLGIFQVNKCWYESSHTIDKRVKKLRPFETVNLDSNKVFFKPDYTYKSEKLVEKSVYYLKKFINDIEKKYPEAEHIILTGGKDSILIAMVPKINKNKWHIFSADPNYALVKKCLAQNKVEMNRLFRHDNRNEESREDIERKIRCGDLYSDIRHIRWLPRLREIGLEFAKKCIFWTGTTADTIYSFKEEFSNHFSKNYFTIHKTRACSWQGNYHQTFKNFVDCPLLSPYHSGEIWQEVYLHFDPAKIKRDTDLRDQIGEKLHGRPLTWPPDNPGPTPYSYDTYINTYEYYLNFIKETIKSKNSHQHV